MGDILRIGTRGSKLALWQANWVRDQLRSTHPGLEIELQIIKTKGDKILDVPLAKVGGKGLFVKEIEDALLGGQIDLAVHSMKDMPALIPEGLKIGPIPERENPLDVLISASGDRLEDLAAGAQIGTSSLRRSAQILRNRPDVEIVPLRGNLDTRLRKLDEGQMDAIVLAAAGVRRLGLADRITQILDADTMLPAVAQGALCIEIRGNDNRTASLLAFFEHPDSSVAVIGERAFLHRLGGSCQVPVAGFASVENGVFHIRGMVAELDGTRVYTGKRHGSADDCREIGIALAEQLLEAGANEVLEKLTEAGNA